MKQFEFLSQLGTPLIKDKGEHVFRQGDEDRNIYVIKKGLLKAYYLSLDGKELVKSFLIPGSFIASMTACHNREFCTFSLVCLENTEVFVVRFDDLTRITAENNDVAQFMISGLLDLAMKKERREYEFLCLSAEDRYRLVREREPELLERITQNDLARYLGITPVALSRIKSRL